KTSTTREATSPEGLLTQEITSAPQLAPDDTASAHTPIDNEGLPPQETPATSYTALGETDTAQASSPAEELLQPQRSATSPDTPVDASSPEDSADELTHASFQDHTVPEGPRAATETSSPQPSVESIPGQSEPSLVEAAAIDQAMERPFLSGNQAIQRSVALPQVTQDLGVYTPLRSPLTLNPLVPETDEGMPVREAGPVEGVPVTSVSGMSVSDPDVAVDSPVSDVLPMGSLPEDSPSLSQTPSSLASDETSDANEIQRQPLEDASGEPNPLVESPSSTPSASASETPQVWDSIADLLAQSTPAPTVQALPQAAASRPDKSTPAPTPPPEVAVPAVAPVIAAPDPFPNLHALENLPARLQPKATAATHTSLSSTVMQRWAADDVSPLAEQHSVTVTAEEAPEGTSDQLDKLAQVMYRMVRQRLAVERERLGRFGPGRFQ
ncbi:MAG: hypothetical protein F6K42_09555, partial [Leptolyngbya sp. SIO1D8]|nr:hypothetical protein [Leptolyngbya sp. SIO1D8]